MFARTRRCHAKPRTPQESSSRALSDGSIHVALNFSRPQTLSAGLKFSFSFGRQRHPPRPPAYRTLSPKWRTAEYKYAARKSGVAENAVVEGWTRARREETGLSARRSEFRPTLFRRPQKGGRERGRLAGLGRSAAPPPPSVSSSIAAEGVSELRT